MLCLCYSSPSSSASDRDIDPGKATISSVPIFVPLHRSSMAPALLTAVDSTDHVHLVIGTNPLAGARCSQSLEVGAKVKLIAPADANIHYGLQKRVDDAQVEWLKKDFDGDDVKTLGREEVDGFVDAVFVTLGGKHALSTAAHPYSRRSQRLREGSN